MRIQEFSPSSLVWWARKLFLGIPCTLNQWFWESLSSCMNLPDHDCIKFNWILSAWMHVVRNIYTYIWKNVNCCIYTVPYLSVVGYVSLDNGVSAVLGFKSSGCPWKPEGYPSTSLSGLFGWSTILGPAHSKVAVTSCTCTLLFCPSSEHVASFLWGFTVTSSDPVSLPSKFINSSSMSLL